MWNAKERSLTIAESAGSYADMPQQRQVRAVLLSKNGPQASDWTSYALKNTTITEFSPAPYEQIPPAVAPQLPATNK